MKEEIKKWYDSDGSYQSGINILHALKKESIVQQYVIDVCTNGGENAFTKKFLKTEIGKALAYLMQLSGASTSPSVLPLNNEAPEKPKKTVDIYSLPPDLIELDVENKKLYAINREIRGQLKLLAYRSDGNPRSPLKLRSSKAMMKGLAMEAVQNQKDINRNWKRIDYFVENNRRMPGTDAKSERQLLIHWLKNLLYWDNYCRKSDTYFKKNNIRQNQSRYDEFKANLKHIDEFIKSA